MPTSAGPRSEERDKHGSHSSAGEAERRSEAGLRVVARPLSGPGLRLRHGIERSDGEQRGALPLGLERAERRRQGYPVDVELRAGSQSRGFGQSNAVGEHDGNARANREPHLDCAQHIACQRSRALIRRTSLGPARYFRT